MQLKNSKGVYNYENSNKIDFNIIFNFTDFIKEEDVLLKNKNVNSFFNLFNLNLVKNSINYFKPIQDLFITTY
jgi:hypothetical protein